MHGLGILMLFLFAPVLFFGLLCGISEFFPNNKAKDNILAILLIAISVGSVTTGIICTSDYSGRQTVEVWESYPLKALATKSEIHGSFFLGCGSINENPQYFYYEKDNDGFYILKSISVYGCRIKLSDSLQPQVRRFVGEKFVEEPKYKITKALGDKWKYRSYGGKVDFIIPENSILEQFDANIK